MMMMMTMMTIKMMMMMMKMMMMKGMRMMVLELQLHYQTDDPSQRCKRCKIVMLRELIISKMHSIQCNAMLSNLLNFLVCLLALISAYLRFPSPPCLLSFRPTDKTINVGKFSTILTCANMAKKTARNVNSNVTRVFEMPNCQAS